MAGGQHGSEPAKNEAYNPNRQVGRGISTQPMALGVPNKYRPEPNVVQRVRRAQPTGTQHPPDGGRKPYGQGGPHPSLSDEAVERVKQQTAVNSRRRDRDPDWQEEGRRLNAEPRDWD